MKRVTSVEAKLKVGTTVPFLVNCDYQFELLVLKCQNKYQTGKALFNELIGYRLARALSLPVPEQQLIYLSQDMIDANKQFQEINAQAGICFASRWINTTSGACPNFFRHATNKEDFAGILLIDQLLENIDRGANRGNWLFEKETKRIVLIDFGAIFRIAQIWDQYSLSQDMEMPLTVLEELNGPLYQAMIKQIKGKQAFAKIEQRIDDLSDDAKADIFREIPLTDWGITNEDLQAAKKFIYFQLNRCQEIVAVLQEHFKL